MSKHTPGPWSLDSDCTGGVVLAKDGSVVVHEWVYQDCSDSPDFDGEKDDEAAYHNARLIAAAPEQNAACLAALKWWDEHKDDTHSVDDYAVPAYADEPEFVTLARAAIAKAERGQDE